MNDETLWPSTAETEHVEMYLKAMWMLLERKQRVRISTIARILNIRPPSVVEMLHKMRKDGIIEYTKLDIRMKPDGEKIARTLVRNSRLLEVFVEKTLGIDICSKLVCGMEHHMDSKFRGALCGFLGHPRKCPHGLDIPPGDCCTE